jgi:hypothetical protein
MIPAMGLYLGIVYYLREAYDHTLVALNVPCLGNLE